jgi:hemerythrin
MYQATGIRQPFTPRSIPMKPSSLPPEALLDDPRFDTAHELAFDALFRTLDTPPEDFPAAYRDVVKGVESDFRDEEDLMDAIGYAGVALHRAHHAHILSGLHHAEAALMVGDCGPARRALETLVQWLPVHITTQDRSLVRAFRAHERNAAQPAV